VVLEATALAERDVPDYIDVDHAKIIAKLTRVPTPSEVLYPVMMKPHLWSSMTRADAASRSFHLPEPRNALAPCAARAAGRKKR